MSYANFVLYSKVVKLHGMLLSGKTCFTGLDVNRVKYLRDIAF